MNLFSSNNSARVVEEKENAKVIADFETPNGDIVLAGAKASAYLVYDQFSKVDGGFKTVVSYNDSLFVVGSDIFYDNFRMR